MNIWLWWLAQNTITAAVMIPLVVLACQLFRRRPAVQHALWVVVLLKFLTPPLVSWPCSVEQMRDAIWSLPASDPKVNAAASRQPPNLAVLSGVTDRVRADHLPVPKESPHADAASTAVATVDQTESTFASTAPDVQALSTAMRLAFQLGGGAWLLGVIVCGTLQLRRIGRHASLIRCGTAPPEQLIAEVKATAKQLGMRPPRVIVVPGILSPFLWCLGCLRLVWPEAMASNARIARSRGIIAHELAHVRRRDHWVASLELVGGVVWWWNPLFWFVRRRLRETAEIACDALAIATNHGSRREYAEMLLELSAGFRSGAPVAVLAVSAGTPSTFERRLSMILSERVSGKLSAWGILAAIGFAIVALPGWSLGQQKQPKKEQTPATEEPAKTPPTNENEQEPYSFTASGAEVDGLQGEWVVVAMEEDGEKAPADDLKGMKWVVKGNEITASQPGGTGKMTFRLDRGKTPKEIDITSLDGNLKGTTSPGIYAIEGRRLRVCNAEQGRRPKEFATAPGDGREMITLEKEAKREGGDDKADEPGFPDNPPPLQLIARLIDESLTITMPATIRVVGSSETMHTIATTDYNLKEIQAFDTRGKRIEAKSLRILLKENTDVLVSADGRPVDPFYLRLVKEGTVVLLLEPTEFFGKWRSAKPEVKLRHHKRVEAVPMPTLEGSRAGDRKELVPTTQQVTSAMTMRCRFVRS
jgi:uncharacterized protein (TIGR03067 family)